MRQTGAVVQVADTSGPIRDAIESTDGKFIYYLSGPGEGENSLWQVPSEGGQQTQVLARGPA